MNKTLESIRDSWITRNIEIAETNAVTGEERAERSRLLSVHDVADLLQVPASWVYGHTRDRCPDRMPGFRLGKYWRFDETDVLAWIRRRRPGMRRNPYVPDYNGTREEKGAGIGKESTIRRRFQEGHVFLRHGKRRKVWAARWREDVIAPNGTVKRVLRFAVLGTSCEISGKKEARNTLQAKLRRINQGGQRPQSTMTLEQFVSELWKPAVIPTLRSGSSRYYDVQLRCHILPRIRLKEALRHHAG